MAKSDLIHAENLLTRMLECVEIARDARRAQDLEAAKTATAAYCSYREDLERAVRKLSARDLITFRRREAAIRRSFDARDKNRSQ